MFETHGWSYPNMITTDEAAALSGTTRMTMNARLGKN